MSTSPLNMVIQHLLADLGPDGDGMTDAELLACFLAGRHADALAALVRRHAAMVWGVCRRLLNFHDAEDAFQATFLVLVRKAAEVPRQAVAGWLYGVARQTSVRLRATAVKRGRREMQVVAMPEPTAAEVCDADWHEVLVEEIGRLPEHHRAVIVLCDLECVTRKEAARHLGIPEGSVASRLARARVLLAKRLQQRGAVAMGGLAALLSTVVASASAPPALVASTVRAVSLLAAGRAASVVPARVAALTEGVVRTMIVTKIKKVLALALVIAAVAGATGLIHLAPAAELPPVQAGQPAAPQEPAKSDAGQDMVKQFKQQELPALIEKILAAHGGEDKLRNLQFTMAVKHSNGYSMRFFVQPPKHFRWETQHRDSTTKEICNLPPPRRQWWHQKPNGPAVPFIYTGLELPMEFHLDYYVNFFGPRQVLRLRDAKHKVTLLQEEPKINGRAAVGMEVTGPHFKGKMYFDKETHLLVKSPAGWYLAGQGAVTYSDYQTCRGIPIPQKENDGYLMPQVTDFRVVDQFEAKLFEQP